MTTTDQVREFHALSLVIGSSVIKVGDRGGYTQAGTAVREDLVQMLDQLLSQGLVTLAWRSSGGLRRVCITRAGRALHTAVFSGDLTAITTVRTMLSQTPANLTDDPAYQCDDQLPGHRHVLDNDQNHPPVLADSDRADSHDGSQQ